MQKDGAHRVLIAAPARTAAQIDLLESAGCVVTVVDDPIEENFKKLLPEADGLCLGIIDMTAEMLESATKLLVVARQGSGTDMVDTDAADRLGIWVANTPGANAAAVAEFTIGALIAAARKIVVGDRWVKSGMWRDRSFFGPELAGRKVAVFGLGKIGLRVAQLCGLLGMRVVAYDPYQHDAVFAEVGAERANRLVEACQGADALLLHAAPSPETERAVNAEILAALNTSATIVNVARSELIDDKALLDALESGRVGAAALDVFEAEPPTDRRLVDHPAVIATPHTAAWSYEARERMTVGAAAEVIRCLQGGPPLAPVNAPPHPRNSVRGSDAR
jgi:D-3-phosphoglycerate dehydrogenase